MGECREATIQAVPSQWATGHLGVPSEGASAPGTRGRVGSASLPPAGTQCQARPRVVAGGSVLPLTMRFWALPRRCPPQREPSAPGSGEASVFPTPVARGAREQPPDAPRRLEGRGLGLGERGAFGGRPQPGPCAREGTAETAGAARGLGELSVQHWSLPRPLRRAAQPEPQRGRQRGRPPASRPAPPGRPGSRPLRGRRRRTAAEGRGNELTELRSPIKGALDAGSRPLRGCKLVGSAPLARSLLTICFGDWAGSGGVGRRERAAAVLPLGRQRVGARKPRGWQLSTPRPAAPSPPSGGSSLTTPLSIGDWLPTPPLVPLERAGAPCLTSATGYNWDLDSALTWMLSPSSALAFLLWLTTLSALHSGTERSLGALEFSLPGATPIKTSVIVTEGLRPCLWSLSPWV